MTIEQLKQQANLMRSFMEMKLTDAQREEFIGHIVQKIEDQQIDHYNFIDDEDQYQLIWVGEQESYIWLDPKGTWEYVDPRDVGAILDTLSDNAIKEAVLFDGVIIT